MANKQRILQKFIENDHEKVDRLIEIYFKYTEKVNQIQEVIKNEKIQNINLNKNIKNWKDSDNDEDEKETDYYLQRLDEGLFTLQLTTLIILDISVNGESTVTIFVKKLNFILYYLLFEK